MWSRSVTIYGMINFWCTYNLHTFPLINLIWLVFVWGEGEALQSVWSWEIEDEKLLRNNHVLGCINLLKSVSLIIYDCFEYDVVHIFLICRSKLKVTNCSWQVYGAYVQGILLERKAGMMSSDVSNNIHCTKLRVDFCYLKRLFT